MHNSRQRRRWFLETLGVHFCRKKAAGGRGFERLWRPFSATNRKKGHPIDAKIIKNQGCVADAFFGWPWAPKGCKYYLSSGPLWRPFSVKNRKKGVQKGIQKCMLKLCNKSMPKGCQNESKMDPNV